MLDQSAPGPTFDINDIAFVDFETRGTLPIAAGSDRYARHAQAILFAWAIGDGPVRLEAVADFSQPLRWEDLTYEFRKFFERVERNEAWLCAHNASFDRAIWQHATIDFPAIAPWMWIDTRVQATASGLPAALEWAVKFTGGDIFKDKTGKKLIRLFSYPKSDATPQSHPIEWQQFRDYAEQDVAAMRDLFNRTRQLPLTEWEEFWVSEEISERGVGIDLDLVEAAARMAVADNLRSARELAQLTSGAVTTVNQVKRMNEWLTALLPSDGREILVSAERQTAEDGTVLQAEETSLERNRIERLLAWLETQKPLSGPLQAVERVLQIRFYGGSKTPAKFSKMLLQHTDGVIRGQYVFNGASQTGRFSARGIQIHNLMRDAAAYEIDAIDALVGGINADDFAALGDDTPISRKLSMLIRPSLVPAPGNVFIWGDWANIEARVTPWLADDREADERLEIFAAVDRGEEKYDIYTRTAADISGIALDQVDRKIRQRGKVVDLACLAADTRVLTDNGIKPIVEVSVTDRVWDGVSWVQHQGLVARGVKPVVSVDGIEVTPDHLIDTGEIWRPASQLASHEKSLCRALAHGSASLPSQVTSARAPAASPIAGRSVPAVPHHTSSRFTIFASPPKAKAASDPSASCRRVSTNLRPVYDIAHAGPRNRFTVITNSGALIVHNCGFGGGKGALLNMAAGYGMHLEEDEAQEAVDRWRKANPWAQTFWSELWEAAGQAVETPKQVFDAGRVAYVYLPGYLGGSLLCQLPSGRFLTYRRCHWEVTGIRDKVTDKVIDHKWELMFSRDMGRMKLWPGLLCENVVQATAADILRGTLVRLDKWEHADDMPVRLHTHDEVLVECGESFADHAAADLRQVMTTGFDWTKGLPIAADTTVGRWYSKNEGSWGL